MYIITASKWFRDMNRGRIRSEFAGDTLKECMAKFSDARSSNDLNKFLPWSIENVENTEEI